MSITEEFSFDKGGEVERFPHLRRYFLAAVIILTALLSFGIGRLTGSNNREGVSINYNPNLASPAAAVASAPIQKAQGPVASTDQSVFASSKGTKYYYQGCKSTISEKNKVTFASAEMAQKAGYTLATNCQKP